MGSDEAETVVEAVGVGASLVGGHLDQGAAAAPSLINGSFQHRTPEALAPVVLVNSNCFDLSAHCTAASQPGMNDSRIVPTTS